jgi:hypothetical protein
MDDLTKLLLTIAGVDVNRYNTPKGKGQILDMCEVGKDHFASKIELAAEQGRKESTMPLRSLAAS